MSLQAEWGFFHWICPSAAGSEASSVDQKQPVFIWISEPDEAAPESRQADLKSKEESEQLGHHGVREKETR